MVDFLFWKTNIHLSIQLLRIKEDRLFFLPFFRALSIVKSLAMSTLGKFSTLIYILPSCYGKLWLTILYFHSYLSFAELYFTIYSRVKLFLLLLAFRVLAIKKCHARIRIKYVNIQQKQFSKVFEDVSWKTSKSIRNGVDPKS